MRFSVHTATEPQWRPDRRRFLHLWGASVQHFIATVKAYMPEPPQHGVIKALASRMPVCIFGDPLQAIFDFKGQKPVDWDSEVFPTFAKLGKLTTPWRWRKSKNLNLANWLEATRIVLENGGAIDLKGRPDCVEWKQVSTTENERRKTITGACKALLGSLGDDTLIVIGDPININARALLGKQLASAGFSRIEPINCKSLYVTATKLDKSKGLSRLDAH